MYFFSYVEPVCCSMPSSNCCFLTCIQISQEAGQVVWYSHLFQNFPQFIVIHTVKGFGIVNKAEVGVFLELSFFSMIQWMFNAIILITALNVNGLDTPFRKQRFPDCLEKQGPTVDICSTQKTSTSTPR